MNEQRRQKVVLGLSGTQQSHHFLPPLLPAKSRPALLHLAPRLMPAGSHIRNPAETSGGRIHRRINSRNMTSSAGDIRHWIQYTFAFNLTEHFARSFQHITSETVDPTSTGKTRDTTIRTQRTQVYILPLKRTKVESWPVYLTALY